eukprot:TRINITY_DN5_c5_g1_i1.p1 TRINITY_DN5_c5_g1~~TRINITY_DN5_c5_g1_i1.p1  ORF type:complete len:538 (+),score=78.66 TRINITY_DN5_c5_g1_i1:43-1656(+)
MSCSDGTIFIRSMLITTATILGIGILALPVKVSGSGFLPFVTTFGAALICQIMVILFLVELLQRTEAMMKLDMGGKSIFTEGETIPLTSNDTPANGASAEDVGLNSPTRLTSIGDVRRRGYSRETSEDCLNEADLLDAEGDFVPNLHTMARYFVPNAFFRNIFDFCVFMHFIIVMIAYALSASNAFGDLFGFDRQTITPFFVIPLAVIIIVFGEKLQNAVACMTFIKATLLVSMMCVVTYVASQVQHRQTDDWAHVSETFLIGTVSLGGSVNVLPVVYSSFTRTPKNIKSFRNGCVCGTIVCFGLNLIWTASVLMIVPQTAPQGEVSLQFAKHRHEISTIPLMHFLIANYPNYAFIGRVVSVFIIISVTVSFVALGLGLKHYLDGAVDTAIHELGYPETHEISVYSLWSRFCPTVISPMALFMQPDKSLISKKHASYLMYLLSFLTILTISLLFAHSLYVILDVFNSALLNIETGVFVAYMTYFTRLRPEEVSPVAIQLPRFLVKFGVVITSLYFGGAVAFDLFETLTNVYYKGSLQ